MKLSLLCVLSRFDVGWFTNSPPELVLWRPALTAATCCPTMNSRSMAGPMSYQVGKLVLAVGVALVVIGLLLMAGARLGFLNLGRLPGDIAYKGKHVSFYFPVVTCLVISAVITGVMWLLSYLRKP